MGAQAQQLTLAPRGCLMVTVSFSFAVLTEHTHPAQGVSAAHQTYASLDKYTNSSKVLPEKQEDRPSVLTVCQL